MFSDLDSYHLKERLVENEDFMLVPAEAWHKLLAWYGMVDGQPPLERKVTIPETRQTQVRYGPDTCKIHDTCQPDIPPDKRPDTHELYTRYMRKTSCKIQATCKPDKR